MKASDLIKLEEVKIPESDLVVKISGDLTWSEWLQIEAIEEPEEKGVKVFTFAIKEWNLTDDKNEPLPITEDNIRLLPASAALHILGKINKIFAGRVEKKKS